MIALLQRVRAARVEVDGATVGEIGQGLLVLLGVENGDTAGDAERLIKRVLDYRVFADDDGRMNCSLREIGGGLLLVPQFTLAADTRKGLRPGFSTAAPPELGRELFDHALAFARKHHVEVGQGRFGADMQVTLTNDGPVTFWLQTGGGR
ncbi:MAG: D-tyrosyl-tRNA(Tyr) deacylase [Burkholderiales bacterium]|nr:D-tyrosyl-tRNA(Tyr) deacylase [Burkholderiales bacterium]